MKGFTLFFSLFIFSSMAVAENGLADKCTWGIDSCDYNGVRIVDLRTGTEKIMDEIGFSKLEVYENTECLYIDDFMEHLNCKKTSYRNSKQFSNLLNKTHSTTEHQAEYFIPLGLTDPEAMAALATTSLGLVVFANDGEVMDFVQKYKTKTTKEIDDFGYSLGREGLGALAFGSYFLGAVLENGKLKKVGLITVTSILASQLITEVVKESFGRKRPVNANSPYEFFNSGHKSFFSGHVSAMFAAAATFSEVYKDDWAGVPYIAYGLAAMVAYGRMHANKHYASDVIMGALAGYLSSKLVLRMHNRDGSNGGLLVAPHYDPETGAIMARFSWVAKKPKSSFSCKEFLSLPQIEKTNHCMDKLFKDNYDDRTLIQKLIGV